MNKTLALAAAGAAFATLAHAPAFAQQAGTLQAKVLATAVLPDGEISEVRVAGPVPAGTQTEANDNFVPTVAIEYFLADNLSVETICCVTQHDVDANAGPLNGAELVSDAKVIPATLTLKYHLDAGGVRPYVGAGPAFFLWIDEQPGAATVPLGVTDFELSNNLGLALQAGIDIPMGPDGFGVSFDAKRYFVGTTARWFAGNNLAIETEHSIDPWVVSAGFSFQF